MTTKVTINSVGNVIPLVPEIKVGQFYQDISKYGDESLYLVTESYGDEECQIELFTLVNVATGIGYNNSYPADEILRIFGADFKDFVLVPRISITVHND